MKRDEAVALTLEVSLRQLDAHQRKLYEELAIFPKDVNIPLATTLFSLFGKRQVTLIRSIRRSFVSALQTCHYEDMIFSRHIQLHDTIRRYLRMRVEPHLITFNQLFLDSSYLLPIGLIWHRTRNTSGTSSFSTCVKLSVGKSYTPRSRMPGFWQRRYWCAVW